MAEKTVRVFTMFQQLQKLLAATQTNKRVVGNNR